MSKIAFLGLGAMGCRMARRLLDAGHEVTVWNRTPARAEELAGLGAACAATPRAAVKGAGAVIAMVRDDAASRTIWEDPDTGALAALQPGALAIESSTLTPERVKAWAGAVLASGGHPVEAPVSGSRPQADAGALVYFLGGSEEDASAAAALLAPLGSSFLHVGPVGAAAVVKLVTNTMLATQVAAWAELLPMMQAHDMDLDLAFAALSKTSAWAPVAGYLTQLMRSGQHAPQFPIELIAKDMAYTASLMPEGGLPMTALLSDRFEAGIRAGLGDENMSALIKLHTHKLA